MNFPIFNHLKNDNLFQDKTAIVPEFKNLTQQFTKINFVAWNLKSINDYALLSE